jgi:hypothetical protein
MCYTRALGAVTLTSEQDRENRKKKKAPGCQHDAIRSSDLRSAEAAMRHRKLSTKAAQMSDANIPHVRDIKQNSCTHHHTSLQCLYLYP